MLSVFVMSLIAIACGPSEAELKVAQEKKEQAIADSIVNVIKMENEALKAKTDSLEKALNALN